MMKAKQIWEVGATVKVGFMTLTITDKYRMYGKWEYALENAKGVEYIFAPYEGLFRK